MREMICVDRQLNILNMDKLKNKILLSALQYFTVYSERFWNSIMNLILIIY